MKLIKFNLSRTAELVIVISFSIALLYLGRFILIPLSFAMFLAFLLFPVSAFLERKLPRILSILLTFIAVIIVLTGISYFFGTQLYHLFENIKDFGVTIQKSVDRLIKLIDTTILQGNINLSNLVASGSKRLINPIDIIEGTISTSTGFLASLGLTTIFTFLFLLYRTSFKRFILYHFEDEKKEEVSDILYTIQRVAKNYFFGLIIVILILGTLNGLGLWVIGLDYPFLFGYLAALLAVIPYIGTFIGGMLPFLYALINQENVWMAIFVLGWYIFVQALEGNILTPNIVGSQVSLNPLIALIALITGGVIWGIPGLILFVPFMAILKVIFDNIDSLKPYGILLSSDFGKKKFTKFKKLGKKIDEMVDPS